MTEKNSCERSFALRNNQIRRDRSTFRTDVSYVVKTASVEFFDDLVMYIERRLRVIIEKVEHVLVVGCGRGSILCSRYERVRHNFRHLGDGCHPIVRRRGLSY